MKSQNGTILEQKASSVQIAWPYVEVQSQNKIIFVVYLKKNTPRWCLKNTRTIASKTIFKISRWFLRNTRTLVSKTEYHQVYLLQIGNLSIDPLQKTEVSTQRMCELDCEVCKMHRLWGSPPPPSIHPTHAIPMIWGFLKNPESKELLLKIFEIMWTRCNCINF